MGLASPNAPSDVLRLGPSSSHTLLGNRGYGDLPPSACSHALSGARSLSYHRTNGRAGARDRQPPVVHRCRFVDYSPASITALASTPSSWDPCRHFGLFPRQDSAYRGVLAVGRGNGDVEIWLWPGGEPAVEGASRKKRKACSQAWCLYRTLPGHVPALSAVGAQSSSSASQPSKIEHVLFSHQVTCAADQDAEDGVHDDETSLNHQGLALPRLFGSNGSDQVLEWEWDGPRAGTIKRVLPMPPLVAIWSMAVSPHSTRLAIGCDDGTVRLANIADDQLEMIRKFDPCKTRLMSIAWGLPNMVSPAEPVGLHHKRSLAKAQEAALFLVSGCADSSLRKWSVKTGRCVGRMTVEKLQGEQTLVWSVVVVGQTIVSGDSLGNVHFWDSRSCSRLQSIRAHRADILCLAVSPDGNCVYSSGVDQKTCQLTLNHQSRSEAAPASRWILSASRRLHSHDVRALAMSPPYNLLSQVLSDRAASAPEHNPPPPVVPVLISGGLDMYLILCPAASPPSASPLKLGDQTGQQHNPISDSPSVAFSDSMHRKVSYVTRRHPVATVSRGARLLLCRHAQSINIWRLRPLSPPSARQCQPSALNGSDDGADAWRKVLEMSLKCQTNLVVSAISPDGRWLVVSDLYEVKLFSLRELSDDNLHPRRVKDFKPFASFSTQVKAEGASAAHFTPDSARLVLASCFTSNLVVVSLDLDDHHNIRVLRVFNQHCARLTQAEHRPIITPPSVMGPMNGDVGSGTVNQNQINDTDSMPVCPEGHNAKSVVTIMSIAVSPDGQWLASSDSSSTLHIFNMDSMKHHCYLATPMLVVNALAFSPSMPSTLLIGFANNSLQIIDVEIRKVPEWARVLCTQPPDALSHLRDSIMGIVFAPTSAVVQALSDDVSTAGSGTTPVGSATTSWSERASAMVNSACKGSSAVLIWGATWVCRMEMKDSKPSQQRCERLANSHQNSKRRRSSTHLKVPQSQQPGKMKKIDEEVGRERGLEFRVTHKYQPLIALDYVDGGSGWGSCVGGEDEERDELVVVERPFFGLLSSLPPAWQRTGTYGS